MFTKLYGLPSNGKKVKEWSIDVYKKGNTAFSFGLIYGSVEALDELMKYKPDTSI